MNNNKITREEALKRWKTALENKRKLAAKLETQARQSYKKRMGEEPQMIKTW